MNYIAYRTDDGKNAGKIRFYCKALEVSRQAFYDYLKRKEQPWKYQPLADAMLKIHAADIVLSPGQKDRTFHNRRTKIHGLAVFHELLEQPQDLLVHWRASSCCKAAKILRSGCRRTFRFIILVGNVSSVIDNFILP